MTKTYTHHSKPAPALGSIPKAGTASPGATGLARVPILLRRAVLGGGTAALALAAAAAAGGGARPTSPDAGLIALCAGLDALQQQVEDLFAGNGRELTDGGLEAADAAAYVIEGEQRRLLDRVCTMTPATVGGCAALARSTALLRPDLLRAGLHDDPDMRLLALLVRGLVRRA